MYTQYMATKLLDITLSKKTRFLTKTHLNIYLKKLN